MELFLLLAAYLIVRVGEDAMATARKQPPPRHEYRMKKLEQRNAEARARGYQPKQQGAFGRYCSGLMADAWDSAHHRRELMADERQRRQERRISNRIERTQRRDARRDEKHARKHAAPDGPAPVGFDVDAPQPVEPEPTPEPTPEVAHTAPTSGGANQPQVEADGTPEHDELAAQVRAAAAPEKDTPETTTGKEPEPAPGADKDKEDTDPSNVIPFPSTPQPTTTATPQRMELPTMTSPNGEITGLDSAINYAEQLSAYCTHTNDQISSVLPSGDDASHSCEQAREALEVGGVSGQPLADVTAVQEQMTEAVTALNQALAQLEAAGAAANSLSTELNNHRQVQEAYVANPDAGHREFVTAE